MLLIITARVVAGTDGSVPPSRPVSWRSRSRSRQVTRSRCRRIELCGDSEFSRDLLRRCLLRRGRSVIHRRRTDGALAVVTRLLDVPTCCRQFLGGACCQTGDGAVVENSNADIRRVGAARGAGSRGRRSSRGTRRGGGIARSGLRRRCRLGGGRRGGALVVADAEDSVCCAAVFSSPDPPSLDPPSEAAPRPMNTIANAINTMAIARSGGPDGCSFGVLTMSTLSPVRGQPDHMYA